MVNLTDVLLAMSNIPVSDPIAEIWGRQMQGGYKIVERTGTLPITISANGDVLLDYRIYGNTIQNGTPTPENPIMPSGCGERTENLFDIKVEQGGWDSGNGVKPSKYGKEKPNFYYIRCRCDSVYAVDPRKQYTISVFPKTFQTSVKQTNLTGVQIADTGWGNDWTVTGASGVCFTIRNPTDSGIIPSDIQGITIIEGSTAPTSYIPYGYKLPLTSAGQDVDIYLGESQTTRRIKKLVLTGQEPWRGSDNTASKYLSSISDYKIERGVTCMSTHYSGANNVAGSDPIPNNSACFFIEGGLRNLYLKGSEPITLADFKAYLAAQYAAGTPVTVWYVLAEPKTGIVNEPLMKIGNYADTIDSSQTSVQIPTIKGETIIDYDGTPKPSQMYVKYKGKEAQ